MPEITIVVDDVRGAIVVEDNADLCNEARASLAASLGAAQTVACARPLKVRQPVAASANERASEICVRVAGIYHNSLTEGPGKRSSVLFQFCPLRCAGCYVPNLHSAAGGTLVPVNRLADDLLDSEFERDGVSILGGEPFAQIDGLLALINELRRRGCSHIVCYSGYTLETLREKAVRQPAINRILDNIDILIDGAFVESLASSAGAWTGSGNQRVIDLCQTRLTGRTICCPEREFSDETLVLN